MSRPANRLHISGPYWASVLLMAVGAVYCAAWLGIDVAVRFLPETRDALGPGLVSLITSIGPLQEAVYVAGLAAYLISFVLLIIRNPRTLVTYSVACICFVIDWVMSAEVVDMGIVAVGYLGIFYLGVMFLTLFAATSRRSEARRSALVEPDVKIGR